MIVYYNEEGRRHLLNEELQHAQHARAARGNAFIFLLTWEDILAGLGRAYAADVVQVLPHRPEVLAHLFQLHLRSNSADLAQQLQQATLRSRVVLKFLFILRL